MRKIILLTGLLTFTMPALADRDGESFSSGGGTSNAVYYGSEPPMSALEIACTLKAVKVSEDQANKTGRAIFEAMKKMNFSSDRMTKTCLLHFLAQIKAESAAGANTVQDGAVPAHKRGYGFIQVTGPSNLSMVSKCMNKVDAPSGNGVTTSPASTIGNENRPYLGALSSLCWWEYNMLNNLNHRNICKTDSFDAAKKVHEIVNTGHIGGSVTGGAGETNARQRSYNSIKQGEQRCRGNMI